MDSLPTLTSLPPRTYTTPTPVKVGASFLAITGIVLIVLGTLTLLGALKPDLGLTVFSHTFKGVVGGGLALGGGGITFIIAMALLKCCKKPKPSQLEDSDDEYAPVVIQQPKPIQPSPTQGTHTPDSRTDHGTGSAVFTPGNQINLTQEEL